MSQGVRGDVQPQVAETALPIRERPAHQRQQVIIGKRFQLEDL